MAVLTNFAMFETSQQFIPPIIALWSNYDWASLIPECAWVNFFFSIYFLFNFTYIYNNLI